MTTANNKSQKNPPVESILLIILFAFGILGFMYTFSANNNKDKTEEVMMMKDKPVSVKDAAESVNWSSAQKQILIPIFNFF